MFEKNEFLFCIEQVFIFAEVVVMWAIDCLFTDHSQGHHGNGLANGHANSHADFGETTLAPSNGDSIEYFCASDSR